MNVENTTLSKKGGTNVALKKRRILELIAKYEPEGRRVIPISEDLHIHRATASRFCDELANDDWIKRNNKQSAYHLAQQAYGDPGLGAFLFSGQTARKSSNKLVISSFNKFCDQQLCKDILNRKRPVHTDDLYNELVLFDFVNTIGAWITYIMMQAVRPDKVIIAIKGTNFEMRKGKDKDKVAETWIDSIKGRWLFHEFEQLELVKKGLSIYNPIPIDKQKITDGFTEDDRKKLNENSKLKMKFKEWLKDRYDYFNERRYDPNSSLWSYYEMHKENFDKLTTAFSNLYPKLFEEFETIREALPDKIQEHKEWDKKYLQGQREQKTKIN